MQPHLALEAQWPKGFAGSITLRAQREQTVGLSGGDFDFTVQQRCMKTSRIGARERFVQVVFQKEIIVAVLLLMAQ